MINAWKVIWVDGRKKLRFFEGNPAWREKQHIIYLEPLEEAVAFAKTLKVKGFDPQVISVRKAFIQTKGQATPPAPGYLWCPYCIKWRKFKLLKIRHDGWTGVGANRCPVCYISDDNYWVKRYNGHTDNLTVAEIRRKLTK